MEGRRRLCAQIDHALIAQFLSYWIAAGKPCELTIKPSAKSPTLIGVIFDVAPKDRTTIEFMNRAQEATRAKIWDITK